MIILNFMAINVFPCTAEVPWSTAASTHGSGYGRLIRSDKEEDGTGRDRTKQEQSTGN